LAEAIRKSKYFIYTTQTTNYGENKMAGSGFGWVACEVTPDQIKDLEGLTTLFNNNNSDELENDQYCACFEYGGYDDKKLNDLTDKKGTINFGVNDTESADGIVEEALVPFFEEAFKQGLIEGVVHIQYNDVYIDNYGSSGGTSDVYIGKDGQIEDPLSVSIGDIPLAQRLELIITINTMIADAKRKALLAKEEAAAA
jgi:hypothetical protein